MNPGLVDVSALIKDATELEPLPASAVRLARLVADEQRNVADVAETIRLDEALTGRLLSAANSSLSGPVQHIVA